MPSRRVRRCGSRRENPSAPARRSRKGFCERAGTAGARVAKMEIRAPFSGIIGLRQVSIGDYVKDGQDMVNLESIDPLKVDFRVPEIHLKQVQIGQTLEVGLDALPGKTHPGKV